MSVNQKRDIDPGLQLPPDVPRKLGGMGGVLMTAPSAEKG
jgi:hypothetical protein